MQNFKKITQHLLNHVLQCIFQKNLSQQKEENELFQFTSISDHQIVNDWMQRKFKAFINENFYEGIQSESYLSQGKDHDTNSKIWELYNLQQSQKATSENIDVSSNEKNQISKVCLEEINKRFNQPELEKFEQSSYQKNNKSFILRLSFSNAKNYETTSTSYIVDWSKPKNLAINDSMAPNISLVNPCINLLTHTQKKYHQICLTHPECIILTSSSLNTLLSTISLTHLILYWDKSGNDYFYTSSRTKDIIKIITTKQIYRKYLELFKFIRLISSFLKIEKDLIRSRQSIYSSSSKREDLINELDSKYMIFENSQSSSIENKLHFILSNYHFQIVNPGEHFTFNRIEFCIRNYNIFPYQTYDLEVFDPSNGKFLALIQEHYLKNVKHIYYTHKKGYITEDLYLNAIKRLEQKQNLSKNNYHIPIFASTNPITTNSSSTQQINSVYRQIDLSSLQAKKFLTKNSLLIESKNKTQIEPQVIFNYPYAIPIDQKNQIFTRMRRIEQFVLLSDTQIQSMIQESVLLQLKQNQVIYNPTMRFQHLFVVLDGICQIKKNSSGSFTLITNRNIFGWRYFLIDSPQEILQKQECDEKESLLTVHSSKATILRIQLNILRYLLFDKIDLLKKQHQKNISMLFDKKPSLNQSENKQIISEILLHREIKQNYNSQYLILAKIFFSGEMQNRFEIFRQQCSLPNPYQINFIEGFENNPVRLILKNYPNIALIF